MSPYEALGLSEGASLTLVKRAYRKLAQKLHPDKNSSADAGVQFKLISEAYEFINAPTAFRSATGLFRRGETPVPPAPKPPWPTSFGPEPEPEPVKPKPTIRRGAPRTDGVVYCTFQDLFGGTAEIIGALITVKIPRGLQPQTKVTLEGYDNFGTSYSCSCTVFPYDPEKKYTVRLYQGKQTLFYELQASYVDAVLQMAEIKNINPRLGNLIIPIDPTSINEKKFIKIENAGLPTKTGRDDLYVEVSLENVPIEAEPMDKLRHLKNMIDRTLQLRS